MKEILSVGSLNILEYPVVHHTGSAPSLSVVLPVHNAERTLTQHVSHLLDLLPDLAARFEVLIVDDGSTDHTEEVALDLAQQYPQVKVVRHPRRLGIEAAAQTGAARTLGDMVIVHAGEQPVNAADLQRMWNHREDEKLVMARCGGEPGLIDAGVLRHLIDCQADAASNVVPEPGIVRMIRRRPVRSDNSRATQARRSRVPAPAFKATANGGGTYLSWH